jgi:hypothetical protein
VILFDGQGGVNDGERDCSLVACCGAKIGRGRGQLCCLLGGGGEVAAGADSVASRSSGSLGGMGVHDPAQVAGGSFVDDGGDAGEIGGDVVFEAIFADVVEKFLQAGNFDDSGTAKSFKRIVGETAAAGVATNFSGSIVGGEASKTHGAGFDLADTGAKGIVFANGAGNDGLKIHFYIFKEMLG